MRASFTHLSFVLERALWSSKRHKGSQNGMNKAPPFSDLIKGMGHERYKKKAGLA